MLDEKLYNEMFYEMIYLHKHILKDISFSIHNLCHGMQDSDMVRNLHGETKILYAIMYYTVNKLERNKVPVLNWL